MVSIDMQEKIIYLDTKDMIGCSTCTHLFTDKDIAYICGPTKKIFCECDLEKPPYMCGFRRFDHEHIKMSVRRHKKTNEVKEK